MKPSFLKAGDSIIIVATAKKIVRDEIIGAIQEIESWGLNVVLGPNLYAQDRQFAGTIEQRTSDLQWAIDHPTAKAVLFARGGYGTVHLIDNLNWSRFKQSPKWLCGFSDLTVLHNHVSRNLGIESMHCTMPIFFKDGMKNEGSESLKNALFGKHHEISFPPNHLNKIGNSTGKLVGGNLSVLLSIAGSSSDFDPDGKILFLEDLTEYFYHLDRMMWQLKRSVKLESLAGLVVGQFTEMVDNPIPFGKTAYEIIFDAVCEYNYPVAFGAPIGHVSHNEVVFMHNEAKLEISGTQSTLHFS